MNKKVLVVFLLVVAALGVSWVLMQPGALPSLTEEDFPKQLAGLPLVKLSTGPDAVKSISRLHGTGIDVVRGIVAMYGSHDGSRQLMVWVSESRSKAEATKLLNIMDEKMPNSNAFSNYQVKILDGRTYYYVSGIGLDNYYYQKGKRLYWVAIKDNNPEATLLSIVDKF